MKKKAKQGFDWHCQGIPHTFHWFALVIFALGMSTIVLAAISEVAGV
jgi:hypothetical protein